MRYPASEKAEIIKLVEQSLLPARRTLEKLGIPPATFYRWYDRYREGGGTGRSPIAARSGLEPYSRRRPRPDRRPGAGAAGAVAARTGRSVHRRAEVLRLGSFGLSAVEGARPHHQPGLCGDQGGERVQGQDHRRQPALADRLHLPQDHWLGLVLSVDRPRRLLAIHRGLETRTDDVRLGRHGNPRPDARGFRP